MCTEDSHGVLHLCTWLNWWFRRCDQILTVFVIVTPSIFRVVTRSIAYICHRWKLRDRALSFAISEDNFPWSDGRALYDTSVDHLHCRLLAAIFYPVRVPYENSLPASCSRLVTRGAILLGIESAPLSEDDFIYRALLSPPAAFDVSDQHTPSVQPVLLGLLLHLSATVVEPVVSILYTITEKLETKLYGDGQCWIL